MKKKNGQATTEAAIVLIYIIFFTAASFQVSIKFLSKLTEDRLAAQNNWCALSTAHECRSVFKTEYAH